MGTTFLPPIFFLADGLNLSKNPFLFFKTPSKPSSSSSSFFISSSFSPSPPPSSPRRPQNDWDLGHHHHHDHQHHQQQQNILVEAYHRNNRLKDLLFQISREGSSPSRVLERDGDWTQEELWAVLRFLIQTRRIQEALKVFNFWKDKEISRINVINYSKIIRLLCEASVMEVAVSTFQDMENYSLTPSLATYNSIIHGFARIGEFDNSIAIFRSMLNSSLQPTPETYNGLVRSYGLHRMYDEMSKCVKWMESEGCPPDEVTYNILISEFARGRLLEKMERIHRILLSKRMNLQSSTSIAMLEAYAYLGILDKMEAVYRRVLRSKDAFIKDNLTTKIAMVYIEKYRFSRLEEFGNEIAARTGRTDLVWCILLLSCASLMSRKGIESLIQEMELAKVGFNISFLNILALFYTKVKNFRALDMVFARARIENVKPDIVLVGALFDACRIGYDGTHVLEVWKRRGFLEEAVEMKTDPLVLTAFGKGFFIRDCEKMYSSLDSESRDGKIWMYSDLVNLVFGRSTVKGSSRGS